MSAIYGIHGEADLAEVRRMGARLAHRGQRQAVWSVTPRVHLGARADLGAVAPPADLPIAFTGFYDNRPELLQLVRAEGDPGAAERISDAELFLALYRRHGLDGLGLIRGQFAAALWDAARQRLLLVCDPLATQLLYVAQAGGRYAFATEYKALLALDDLPARPDRDAIRHLQCTKQPIPHGSMLLGVRPLMPGTCLELGGPEPIVRRYRPLALRVAANLPEAEHARALRQKLVEAARRQTRGRDAMGIALSSGLDSAVTIGAVRHVAPHLPLHTFTAGFGPGDAHLAAAAAVASHFGTEHHEVVLEPDQLPDLLPRVVWHMEDPIGREEMVFWYLIAREAGKHVPLLLCGTLADLLFGGMPRFLVVKAAATVPLLKRPLEEFYNCTQNGTAPASLLGRLLARAYHRGTPMPPPAVHGAGDAPDQAVFDLDDPQPLNARLIAGLQDQPNRTAAYERLYAAGGIAYNSPFYDLDVVDHAFTVPDRLKIRGRQQKYIVRQAAKGLLPAEILRRPKGLLRLARDRRFSEVLAALAADHLSAARVRERGLFDPVEVERIRRLPAEGVYPEDQLYRLWTLLLTEIWAGIFLDGRGMLPATAEEAALADAA